MEDLDLDSVEMLMENANTTSISTYTTDHVPNGINEYYDEGTGEVGVRVFGNVSST